MASNWIHGNLEVKEHKQIKTQEWYFTFKGKSEITEFGYDHHDSNHYYNPVDAKFQYEFKIIFKNEKFHKVEFDMKSPYDRNGWHILHYISERIAEIEDGFKNKEG